MEFFTQIEFNISEFDQIDNIVSTLELEGWKMYNKEDFHIIRPKAEVRKQLVSKIYKFVRYINK